MDNSERAAYLRHSGAKRPWEKAGNQCGCHGDRRETKEQDQTRVEMGVVAIASINQMPSGHKQI